MTIDVSIIFPIHNEAKSIQSFLEDTVKKLHNVVFSWEIICVENGSTDNSYEKIKHIAKKHKSIRVIQSDKGWGNAVIAGISHAQGELTCYMVSDGQVDTKYIAALYELYRTKEKIGKHVALVKVWRMTRENQKRLVNSRLYNVLARMLLRVESRDINATPKILATSLLRSCALQSHNIALDLELLVKLKRKGYQWSEVGITSNKRLTGRSTTNISASFEMLRAMCSFVFY